MFIDPLRDDLALRQEGHVYYVTRPLSRRSMVFDVQTSRVDMALLTEG